jgi:hypothetical protein
LKKDEKNPPTAMDTVGSGDFLVGLGDQLLDGISVHPVSCVQARMFCP